jgi:hypothetical protein
VGDEVLNVRGEGVGVRKWRRGGLGCAVVLPVCGVDGRGGYGRGVGTSPPDGQSCRASYYISLRVR